MKFSKVSISEQPDIKSKKRLGFYSKKQKARYLAFWRESPLTQSAFCHTHELNLSTFNNWLRKEKKIKRHNLPPDDAEQEVSAERSSIEAPEDVVELCFPNGCCLKFSSQANMKNLSLIVRDLSCKLN